MITTVNLVNIYHLNILSLRRMWDLQREKSRRQLEIGLESRCRAKMVFDREKGLL